MSKMNLEQDLQRFSQWRSKRQKIEPIPDDLWISVEPKPNLDAAARGPISNERLSLLPDGRLRS